MNNFKIKILGLFLLNALSLVISDQLETDRVSKERNKIFSDHGCREGECEIIKIGIPRRHKRSVDSAFDLPIKAFGREINLKLVQSKGILAGPKTPVYLAHSATNIEKRLGYFSSNMRSQLYEDEEHLAAFTIDEFENGSPQIKYGYIGSENIIIDPANPNSNSSEDENLYLAKCSLEEIYEAIVWLYENIFGKPPLKTSDAPIPDVIYPEILVIVDHAVASRYKGQTIYKYILQFWSSVDSLYRPLKNPKYKLSIAGVVIAQNEKTFPFLKPSAARLSGKQLISYGSALQNMKLWLKQAKSSIPYTSYDAHIIMTPYADGLVQETSTVGLAVQPSACSAAILENPNGGIIYDPYDFRAIVIGAHELGHILGAGHDDDSCGEGYIMASHESNSQKTWSQCSIDGFRKTLRTWDFSCMYNKPDLGNYNSKNNYSPFNDQRVLHSDNINIRPVVYHEEVDDDDYKIVVSIDELLPDREIEIFYENNTLIATQKNTDKETINSSNERKNLKICVLDNMKVTFGPSELNPSEILNIYHEENKIYIHQGSKPECLRDGGIRTPDVPKNNEDNRPDQELSIKDGTIMCVIKKDFKLNKLVGIYYRDNEIFVSQRGSPINYNLYDETIAADLRYVGSDKTKIFLDPKKIDPMKKICIMHRDNSIYIFQGRKPDLSLRENKPDEIKYLPEDSNPDVRERNPRTNNSNIVSASDINNNNNNNKTPVPEITRKLPKPDNEKSKSVLDITFASGETFNICPSEFDKEKAFLILFENNLMKVTQIGAPRIRLSIGKKNELSIIKSDEYKLVVIPAAFHSQAELKIRHENGKIYFWIGTDELPNVNIDSPYRVEVVERDSIFSERPRNIDPMPEIFESGKVHVLLPLEFRFVQLVSIALDDNHKLNVTQKGAPFEDPSYIPSREYKNFKIMTSDRNKLLLHPRKVDSYRYLHIKHDNDNGLIYVSSGTPEYPFVNTNVSDIIEIIKPDPKVNAAPGSIDKIPQSGDRPSAPKSMGPEPGHRQPVYNNGSVVPGSTGPVFGYRPPVHKNGSPIPESKQPVPEHMESEPGYKQPVHNNEPPIPESKQPVPNFKGSEPGYKQPVHNNESPIPESMQPVPEHKEFEPGYKQPAHNNRSPIPESKQPVPESKASEPGYKQPVHNNEPPKPESKQLVPESKGSEPGYKQPVHNNGLPIPESMQPVPEHKGSEPDHTTSYPYDVKPKPDHKPSEPDDLTIPAISKSVDDSLPVVLTSNMFNLNKLVVISHKKHKINVYQTDRDDDYDEDDNENNSGYTDLHYSIPKRGTVTFDPRKINPNKMIIINYINKKIHVNSAEL